MSSERLKNIFFESLVNLGAKIDGNIVSFIKPNLTIKHKKSGVEYTVYKVDALGAKLLCYRYYANSESKKRKKKMYILISKKDFNKYEPV